jgi:hypothetical protein
MNKQLLAIYSGSAYNCQWFAGDMWRCGQCNEFVGENTDACDHCGALLELHEALPSADGQDLATWSDANPAHLREGKLIDYLVSKYPTEDIRKPLDKDKPREV